MGHMSQGDQKRHEEPSHGPQTAPSRMLVWPPWQTKAALHFVDGIRNRTYRLPP
jgi:hypothetical protein